jgi:hypothetical protein
MQCEAACKAKQADGNANATDNAMESVHAPSLPCVGWTLHHNADHKSAPGWRCCTKTSIRGLTHAPSTTTSGILHPEVTAMASTIPAEDEGGIAAASPAAPAGGNVTFSEYYDLKSDPWQITNLWPSLDDARKRALMAEIDRHFACTGTRTMPSNCE